MNSKYAFIFDLRRCIGCETCTIACKVENNLEPGENWIRVHTLGDIGKQTYPEVRMSFRPVTCMHCRNAPCLTACPDGAIVRREDGIVFIDGSKCSGCELCLPACPYNVIHFDARKRLASKCDFCRGRIDRGLEPFCARECPVGAIRFAEGGNGEGYALLPEAGAGPVHRYVE
ncbi:MAG: 4Fe-4S dicluster domain-containing protein [Chloroflexi bacterium]|nr:4Fe-4S dicluster domain-containing protein [Chloroflexota bacterium]